MRILGRVGTVKGLGLRQEGRTSDTLRLYSAVPLDTYGVIELGRDARRLFPELGEDLAETEGIHILLGILWLAARTAIDEEDLEFFDRIVSFIDDVLGKADSDPGIENAVEISFLEYRGLVSARKGRRAFERLPQSIPTILQRQSQ